MKHFYIPLVFTFLPLHSISAPNELELLSSNFGKTEHEISGINKFNDNFLIVADDEQDHFIFKTDLKPKHFSLTPYLDLSKLKGFAEYKKSILQSQKRSLDLEGICFCGHIIYLANERPRHILAIDVQRQTLEKLPIDFSSYKELTESDANAGFEGIAADCANYMLYVAKERQPRHILIIDLKSLKLLEVKDLPTSDRHPQKIIDFKTGDGLMTLAPDISDLFFENGFLYVLERSSYEITKIAVKTWNVINRVSYFKSEQGVYDKNEPYGLAEALLLTKDKIYLGLDNNKNPFSAHYQLQPKRYLTSGIIFTFKRPAGF